MIIEENNQVKKQLIANLKSVILDYIQLPLAEVEQIFSKPENNNNPAVLPEKYFNKQSKNVKTDIVIDINSGELKSLKFILSLLPKVDYQDKQKTKITVTLNDLISFYNTLVWTTK